MIELKFINAVDEINEDMCTWSKMFAIEIKLSDGQCQVSTEQNNGV